MRITVILLSTIICILFCNSSAFSESSWVLWIKHERQTVDSREKTWEMNETFPKYEQCLEAKKELWKRRKKFHSEKLVMNIPPLVEGVEIKEMPFEGFIQYYYRDKYERVVVVRSVKIETYFCLPEIIDPRK